MHPKVVTCTGLTDLTWRTYYHRHTDETTRLMPVEPPYSPGLTDLCGEIVIGRQLLGSRNPAPVRLDERGKS